MIFLILFAERKQNRVHLYLAYDFYDFPTDKSIGSINAVLLL